MTRLQKTIVVAEDAEITNTDYLKLFGVNSSSMRAGKLWRHLLHSAMKEHKSELEEFAPTLEYIFENGTLATRIMKALGGEYSEENIRLVYRELGDCLEGNEMFEVCLKEKF